MMNERSGLLAEEEAPVVVSPRRNTATPAPLLTMLFEPQSQSRIVLPPSILIPIDDLDTSHKENKPCSCTKQDNTSSTCIGSAVFLLYHVVFCLVQAATITRPRSTHTSTGILAQTAALGVVFAGPVFLWQLSDHIPAIYPASDLFLAPFLAQIAEQIDEALYQEGLENDDAIFFGTFATVLMAGFLLSGLLCVLAARVRLANLGAFLPYSVLCGFFATIGILMWTLGFSVDTGQKLGAVLFSGDLHLMGHALKHHLPSLGIGVVMHVVGPKNPFLVILLVCMTVIASYILLWWDGLTLEEAQADQWFFSANDLVHAPLPNYGPPLPFGAWASLLRAEVSWKAFHASLHPMLALAFLYLVRCSLHSAALKKNIRNVTRKRESPVTPSPQRQRRETHQQKKRSLTLGMILEEGYGYSQIVAALVGGITVAPSVAASLTLFKLGAEAAPPQYGSCLLVLLFYVTDFTLVQYIPKPAFSCLMVLAALDMCRTWMVGSYFKTKAKVEWMVAPILVVLAFLYGMLNAILMGVAISTFIFVANCYRAGTVKFVGNGLTLRSTVERGVKETAWLDQEGDMIQILVLQNYLFFGNAQSAFNYITTMFEDATEKDEDHSLLPPVPKDLVVDFTLVSGMDTSAVDIIREIVELCQQNKCQLYLAGLHLNLKSMLLYAGVKPISCGATGSQWMYTVDLESALAKAEDGLLSHVFHLEEKDEKESSARRRQRRESIVEDGFLYALHKLDEQHGLNSREDLSGFLEYTCAIDLKPGDTLVREQNGGGLYFVETGLMQVQKPSSYSTVYSTLGIPLNAAAIIADPTASIGHLNARSESVGRQTAVWKEEHRDHHEQTFRLARIGQGWIIGGIETSNGMKRPGVYVAMSETRLHHLPKAFIERVEEENPTMAMHLYKLLSHLSTKRQEMTIEQLGQFVRILNSPIPRLRGGKRQLGQLQNA